MDVKSMYPSLEHADVALTCRKEFFRSTMIIKEVDPLALDLYLANKYQDRRAELKILSRTPSRGSDQLYLIDQRSTHLLDQSHISICCHPGRAGYFHILSARGTKTPSALLTGKFKRVWKIFVLRL